MKRGEMLVIFRLPRSDGYALDIMFAGERVTLCWHRNGVPLVNVRPPVECSLDEFTIAFLKAYPAARERLADVLPDGL